MIDSLRGLTFTGRAAAHMTRIAGPLRTDARFRRCFVADQVNAAGTTVATGALAFTVLGIGGGASGIAMVLLATMAAGILAGPMGGVVADRFPRALVISVVQVIIGLITVVEATLIFTGRAAVWNLAALAGANSAAASFSGPARTGLVGAIVAGSQLSEANALSQLARHIILTIGPAIGGAVVAMAGAGYGVGCNAISFFVSAALMARIHAPCADRQPSTMRADLIEGWTTIRTRRWIWTCLIGAGMMIPAWHVGYGILGPPYAESRLGGAWAWGLITSSLGCGMALGAAVSLIWRPRLAGWTNCLGTAALALPEPLMAAGAPLPAVMAAVVVAACGLSMSVVAWRTAIQQDVPLDQQGRVSAFAEIAEIALTPVGYLLVAPVTDAIGIRATLLMCGIIVAVASLAPLLSRDVRTLTLVTADPPAVEELPADPAPDGAAPDLSPPPVGQPSP
ncbi:MFS transporter [Actinoallomurus sp. CA-142502]|uniref:MFS transporter n=1 Tax=Actinoallomurus iriomotensis TaxID=478107 RepID=A0A9W6RH25_9ACTN|nr:MFS transporter [Actinoallomurus iriomotensis]